MIELKKLGHDKAVSKMINKYAQGFYKQKTSNSEQEETNLTKQDRDRRRKVLKTIKFVRKEDLYKNAITNE